MSTRPDWDALLQEGESCWRRVRSPRVGVLRESGEYFAAVAEACSEARHSIFVVGWDFDRNERLGRAEDAPTMERFFCDLLDARPELQVWLLSWDYAFVYAAEREWFQEQRLRHLTHERLHVCFDGAHPVGGSQHQKFVVIDDRVAFNGGIDLSRWRWDTADHAPGDERRTDPDGEPYQPFHDLMLAVDGEAARTFGELARQRWQAAGADQQPPALEGDKEDAAAATDASASDGAPGEEYDPWPKSVAVRWQDVELGIARTYPAWDGRDGVREVEKLYLRAIAAATTYIYIENQYLTSRSLGKALAERLSEKDGPEIIIVLPRETGGWLEQVTMDALRTTRISALREHDGQGRLRVLYPHQPGLADDECIMVHAKLMLADDRLVRIGSANTTNRSMGLDSECDIAFLDTQGEGAAGLLHDLLAEHLDVDREQVRKQRETQGSVIGTIDELARQEGRSLRPLTLSDDASKPDVSEEEDLVDPDEPIDSGFLVSRAVPPGTQHGGNRRLYLFIGFVVVLLLLGAGWRWTPLGEWANAERLADGLAFFDSPLTRFVAVFVAIVVTSLFMMPLTVLVVAAAILLGPWVGFVASLCGALVSAAVAFIAGEITGGSILERYGESRIHRLSEKLSDRGILAVAVLRLIPIAPYTIVNIVAGASHLKLIKFLIGSALGLLPGLAALSWFSGSLLEAVKNPSLESLGVLAVVIVLIFGGSLLLRRLLKDS